MLAVRKEWPHSEGHPLHERLNQLLAEADFDRWVERRCKADYEQDERRSRPSIPHGVYFRMLLVGYFEDISSQRGIAWRCADSLSLRKFLGLATNEESPDHSSLTIIRDRLPLEVRVAVLQRVLPLARDKKILQGRTLRVDSTTLEANAAMKSIVRKETGKNWQAYLTTIMCEAGVIEPDDTPGVDDLQRFDKSRKNKKVSNQDWESSVDPDSRITKMKDGTPHLVYKAEHAVDLESGLLAATEIYPGTQADTRTLEDTVHTPQGHLQESGSVVQVQDVVADEGYYSVAVLGTFAEYTTYRPYMAEPQLPARKQRTWTHKPARQRQAVDANRRLVRNTRGRRLQRSERVERTFAPVCETGGARRTRLRGIDKVRKRYLLAAAARRHGTPCFRSISEGMPGRLRGLWLRGLYEMVIKSRF